MTGSYKLAFLAAATVCAVIIGFSTLREQPPDEPPLDPVPPPLATTIAQERSTGTLPLADRINRTIARANRDRSVTKKNTPASAPGEKQPALADGKPPVRTYGLQPPSLTATSAFAYRNRIVNTAESSTATDTTTAGPTTVTTRVAMPSPPTPRPVRATTGSSSYTPHTIKAGDTFSTLAVHAYGLEKYWVNIARANNGVDPHRLRPGQVIRLPDMASLQKRARPALPTGGRKTHVVRSSNTLWTVAQQYYGTGDKWPLIYHANRGVIGSDPGKLEVGMSLVIPIAMAGASNE